MAAQCSEAPIASVDFRTAEDLYKVEIAEENISTGVPEMDDIFGNGIPPATFLEVVGCSSTGKTQLCMQLAVMTQKRHSRRESVYIDTEGGFSTLRLCDIARFHFSETPENLLQSIKHCRCRDLVELMSTVHQLHSLLEQNREIGLVIVDSIAMPFRGETDYTKTAIASIATALSRVAVDFRCLVVVVNHVTTRFRYEEGSESAYLSSALGTSWSQRPCVRVWLCPPNTESSHYSACLVKSPSAPPGLLYYTITMKFLAVLADQGATDTLSKITETVSKLCKDHVVLRITQDSFMFISSENNHISGAFFEISLNTGEFFSTFTMAGVSEEFNEIFMEVDKDFFYRSINAKEQTTKMRLTKIGNSPHLKVELKTCAVVHEMPVALIPARQWRQYAAPTITGTKVAVFLPSLVVLRNLIASIKNMSAKHLVIQGNQKGELYFNGDVDAASVQIYFSELVNSTVDEPNQDQGTWHEVRVSVKEFYVFLRSVNSNFTISRILLRIVPDKMAAFSIQQDDASLLYCISGVVV